MEPFYEGNKRMFTNFNMKKIKADIDTIIDRYRNRQIYCESTRPKKVFVNSIYPEPTLDLMGFNYFSLIPVVETFGRT